MTLIIAVDPGPHMGIATRLNNGTLYAQMIHNDMLSVWKYLTECKPDVIICERFATAARISGDGLYTVEAQGSIAHAAWALKAEFIWQRPQDRAPFIETAKELLGKVGSKKIDSHEVDAAAHLLRWEYMRDRQIRQAAREAAALAGARVGLPALEIPGAERDREDVELAPADSAGSASSDGPLEGSH